MSRGWIGRAEPVRWIGRSERNWTDAVVIRSYDEGLADPEPAEAVPVAEPAGPSGCARVVPAWLVAAAVLLACSASVAASLWWQHRSRIIEVTRRVQPYYTAGPDAIGCPNLSSCLVQADIGQPLNALARRLFPDATVLSSVSVADSDTGRTVQTTIVLATVSGVEVSANAQCVPGAGPISGRAASLPAAGPAQADFVVAGAPGCSVAVAAQIPRGTPVPLAQLERLAGDPRVQLRPSA
ncbi:MAG: hypothetical protein QOI26_1933 [Pseudonocardiales bacterium]|jgi:hypothetical protein|nr:hypothetical protein [Pseudonocardiales bacterium]